jgi:hypothetical protein
VILYSVDGSKVRLLQVDAERVVSRKGVRSVQMMLLGSKEILYTDAGAFVDNSARTHAILPCHHSSISG